MRISSSRTRTTGRTIRHFLVRPAAVHRRCRTDSRTVTFRGAGPADDCAPGPPLSIRKSRTVRRLPIGPVTPRDRSDRRRPARGPVCHPTRQTDPPGRPTPPLRRPAPFPRAGSGSPPRSPDHHTPADPPRFPRIRTFRDAYRVLPRHRFASRPLLRRRRDYWRVSTTPGSVRPSWIRYPGAYSSAIGWVIINGFPLRGVSAGVFSGVTQQCGPALGAPLT